MPNALELRKLTKRYDDGTLALDSLDLEVPSGSFFGLLGPNGAGKTTLISAVCNLIRLTDGEISVFGHPGGSMEARRLVGIAEQEPNLDRFLTVFETLVYHGGYYGMSGAAGAQRAAVLVGVFCLCAQRGGRWRRRRERSGSDRGRCAQPLAGLPLAGAARVPPGPATLDPDDAGAGRLLPALHRRLRPLARGANQAGSGIRLRHLHRP